MLLEYYVPPNSEGEDDIFPLLQASLKVEPQVTHAKVPGEPVWTMLLWRLTPDHLQKCGLDPKDPSCYVGFLLNLPVGSTFFKERRAGTVTRRFGINYTFKSIDGGEYSGDESIKVTSVRAN